MGLLQASLGSPHGQGALGAVSVLEPSPGSGNCGKRKPQASGSFTLNSIQWTSRVFDVPGPAAFSALWAAKQEATGLVGLGAEPGTSSPLQWAVRDSVPSCGREPGSPGIGRAEARGGVSQPLPDHGQGWASSRKSWAPPGGRGRGSLEEAAGKIWKAVPRAGPAPRSGAAPGPPHGLSAAQEASWPPPGVWGWRQVFKTQWVPLGTGSRKPV